MVLFFLLHSLGFILETASLETSIYGPLIWIPIDYITVDIWPY